MITQTRPEDSICTRELHDAVNELKKIAGASTIRTSPNDREVFLHLASAVEHVERVSRRIDGEVSSRAVLQTIVGEVIDILGRVSRSSDDNRLKELADLLKLLT